MYDNKDGEFLQNCEFGSEYLIGILLPCPIAELGT
jgi:hypothetical protein